jgi:hypothetical protein
VATSWTIAGVSFKSPVRVVVGFLLRSRETKARKCREQKRELDEARRERARLEAELQREREEKQRLQAENQRLQTRLRQQTRQVCLPDDPRLKGHGFGARLISLAINLATRVGFRAAADVLKIMFNWLGVKQRIPKWSTIRMWMLRAGLAAMQEPAEPADDWEWLVDHSNQVGPEKALVILGIRASQMPKPGETLKHEHVRLLAVQPGTNWKREDVARVYLQVAEQYGYPRAVTCDGAVELREGVPLLQQYWAARQGPSVPAAADSRVSEAVSGDSPLEEGDHAASPEDPPAPSPGPIVLHDFKHKAANLLEAMVGKHPRFAEFHGQVGTTRAAVQQTELAYLRPPGKKPKARFMNLGPTLRWGAKVLWLTEHPEARSRRWVAPARLEEKLGWVRSYATEIGEWEQCQQVVDAGLKFINNQGLYRGAGEDLRAALAADLPLLHASARQLGERLVAFVAESEKLLKEGERLAMSTEILESTFGLYKQLERQHSRGGFTSLLAGFGALLKPATPERVRSALATVKVRDVRAWVAQHLGHTLNSKRLALHKEYRRATQVTLTT